MEENSPLALTISTPAPTSPKRNKSPSSGASTPRSLAGSSEQRHDSWRTSEQSHDWNTAATNGGGTSSLQHISIPPGHARPELGLTTDVRVLQQQVAALQTKLDAANANIVMWERCMQQLFGCLFLSPDMNEMYKSECMSTVREALLAQEQITDVHYVECSFPSVPSEAPRIKLQYWHSLDESEWQVKWSPSWSVKVSMEGLQYVQLKLIIRIFDLKMSGRLRMKLSADMSTITLSFVQLPRVRLKTECSGSWGSVPLPIQAVLDSIIVQEFHRWLTETMVLPNEMVLKPSTFQPKGITDEDVEKARRAVALAREYSEHR
mmetsp:Transcript_8517/g.14386  ORF Transcript_8517/g.14386 Transcript_8517/m.14386 type:complete len:320 (+) Transcript_8517:110-1069(+)